MQNSLRLFITKFRFMLKGITSKSSNLNRKLLKKFYKLFSNFIHRNSW